MSNKENYLVLSFMAEERVKNTIVDLGTIRSLTNDSNIIQEATSKKADYSAELARIISKRTVFMADETGFKPPEDSVIDTITEKVKALDEMIANANNFKTIINTTTEIIETWNETNS